MASPWIDHSKPRFRSVGGSTWKRPALVGFWAKREEAAKKTDKQIVGRIVSQSKR